MHVLWEEGIVVLDELLDFTSWGMGSVATLRRQNIRDPTIYHVSFARNVARGKLMRLSGIVHVNLCEICLLTYI